MIHVVVVVVSGFGSSSSSVQMVPAPPDFSMTPSLSVLVNRVSMALNTADEQPKPVSSCECTLSSCNNASVEDNYSNLG